MEGHVGDGFGPGLELEALGTVSASSEKPGLCLGYKVGVVGYNVL